MPTTNKGYVQFELFTDAEHLWESKEDMNAWFSQIYVPMASACDPGVVRKATRVPYEPNTMSGDYYEFTIMDPDVGPTVISLVKKDRYDLLEAKTLALEVAYQTLIASLVTAGILSNDPDETCS